MGTRPLRRHALIRGHSARVPPDRHLQGAGLDATTAGAVFVPFAAASAVSAVVSGFLIDRWGPRPVFILAMCLLIAALGWLQLVQGVPAAIVYATALGSSSAISQTISGVIWAHFYGRHGLGRIQGSAMMIAIAGAAIGPLPLALLEQASGNFQLGLLLMTLLPAVAVVSMWRARPVRVGAEGPVSPPRVPAAGSP
ncbi:MAG: MFS transporter [Dehalococcoidia bacterium]|nr:MFS transporter [Dehalococcoidia bacterium]